MKSLAIAISLFFLLLGTSPILKSQESRPNIVFVIADDLNDWVGFLNEHPNSYTPNIDKLAAKSIIFMNAYANVPLCNPSRISLMTGLHPSQTGINSNSQRPLSTTLPFVYTLNNHLEDENYNVRAFGKVYHQRDNSDQFKGNWDWNGNYPSPQDPPIHGIHELTDEAETFDWGPIDLPEQEWGDHKITVDFNDFIGSYDSNKPFYAALGFRLPHLPRYYPKKYSNEFRDVAGESISIPVVMENDTEDLPQYAKNLGNQWTKLHEEIKSNEGWENAVKDYLASVYFIDAQIGRVLASIESSKYDENTIIIFTSDHGYMLGEKNKWRKNLLWRDALRVPLLIYDPRRSESYIKFEEPVSLIDIYPTIQNLAGLSERTDLLGSDLIDLVENNTRDRAVISLIENDDYSVINKNFHLIEYHEELGMELYDISEDKNEWTNLITNNEYADVLQDLINKKDRFLESIEPINSPTGIKSISILNNESGKFLVWETNGLGSYSRFELEVFDSKGIQIIDTVSFTNKLQILNEELSEADYFTIKEATPLGYSETLTYNLVELNSSNEYDIQLSNRLYQNYPNPFNAGTTINFQIHKAGFTEINLFNMLGKKIATIFSGYKEEGLHSVAFNSNNIASGLYFYRLEVNNFIEEKKLTLLK